MSDTPGSEAVLAAAERLLPGGMLEPVEHRSWLLSALSDGGRFSVRQLDPALPSSRIELIHEFLRQPGLHRVTLLTGVETAGTTCFDARSWVPADTVGSAVVEKPWQSLHLPSSVEIDQLGRVAASLGAFHRSGLEGSIVARAPHFRLKDALLAARRSLDMDERRLASEIRKESRARRWLGAARPLLQHGEQALEQAGFLRDEPNVVAHLDLWGSHIVLDDAQGATFLDCARIGSAPAGVDIAQLIARNGTWSDERVERVLQQYATELPFNPLQRRVLPWLIALDAIPTCGRLLARAHNERDPLSNADRRRVFAAADIQLDLLTSLETAFVPRPSRQRWRHSRRSSSS